MKLTRIQEAVVPIASDIRNAYIDFSKMDVSVVKITTDVIREGKPVVGYGFNSNGRYAQSGILRHRILPRLEEADPADLMDTERETLDPFRAWDVMMRNEKPGGHGERSVAVGIVDMALWDIVAKIDGRPLHMVLADRFNGGLHEDKAFVYAAGGYYYPGKDNSALQKEMSGYLEMGYSVVKMKIGGAPLAEDLARIEAAIAMLDGDGSRLAVDANGRFDLETALAYARALDGYGLRWYEEAGDPLDYALQATLGEVYSGSMATGENLFSHQDCRNLIRYGGMRPDRDIFQFDPALSYGLVEYTRTLAMMAQAGWSARRCIPHGGHQFALSIAAGMGLGGNESYPGIFPPFGGFSDGARVSDGYVDMPASPGIGMEEKAKLMDLYATIFD
ncbi:mandelate racemase/muconate lactonizing enzyme family protein [Pelagibacterium montanilacus]|uniref:mandelate racemase/muconate lactonizing enzyme family protein n=1 Tax=Pelagibacterium montanilacus TaxID=2185280 RepID=UPI000F8F712B|nr:mandelate racemase/muconate lactonizing enzyme family protein [Pelagibacterium montanilacus]